MRVWVCMYVRTYVVTYVGGGVDGDGDDGTAVWQRSLLLGTREAADCQI